MKATGFNRLLEQLRKQEGDSENRPGAFKVSAGVGLTVLSLAPQKQAAQAETAQTMPEEPQNEPGLSLAELPGEIAKALTAGDLRRLRRRFALLSHPDRCLTSSAAPEMAAANRLIDDAIAALRQKAPSCAG